MLAVHAGHFMGWRARLDTPLHWAGRKCDRGCSPLSSPLLSPMCRTSLQLSPHDGIVRARPDRLYLIPTPNTIKHRVCSRPRHPSQPRTTTPADATVAASDFDSLPLSVAYASHLCLCTVYILCVCSAHPRVRNTRAEAGRQECWVEASMSSESLPPLGRRQYGEDRHLAPHHLNQTHETRGAASHHTTHQRSRRTTRGVLDTTNAAWSPTLSPLSDCAPIALPTSLLATHRFTRGTTSVTLQPRQNENPR